MKDENSWTYKDVQALKSLNPKDQFPTNLKTKYDLSKPIKPQIASLEDTPFVWIDTEPVLIECMRKIREELVECPLLALDLEFYIAYQGEGIDIVRYLAGGGLAIMQIST